MRPYFKVIRVVPLDGCVAVALGPTNTYINYLMLLAYDAGMIRFRSRF